jgi:large repetitive protein
VEGNDIEDLGNGRFRTVAATTRYSLLDQYAMGLIDQSAVPPLFVVQNPTDVTPPRGPSSAPEVGVTFSGARRDLTIDDIIASTGARVPSAAESKRVYRQGFMYITSLGRGVTAAEVDKVDRIRVAWGQFLSAATDSRMIVDTRLRTGPR